MNLAHPLDEFDMRPFKLQYKGPLYSHQGSKGDRKKKAIHDIRRAFHEQLIRPWKSTPELRHNFNRFVCLPERGKLYPRGNQEVRLDRAWAITKLSKNGRELCFIPLVIRETEVAMTCELDIRIGWREKPPRGIFRSTPEGFDLDNRLKGLLDALTIPQEAQLPNDVSIDPSPYFLTLLEDDGFVTRIGIRADPLGSPAKRDEEDGYVELDIDVTVYGDATDDL
jgi:hypothetical protein